MNREAGRITLVEERFKYPWHNTWRVLFETSMGVQSIDLRAAPDVTPPLENETIQIGVRQHARSFPVILVSGRVFELHRDPTNQYVFEEFSRVHTAADLRRERR